MELYESYCRAYQAVFRVATKFLDWSEPQLIKGAGSVRKLAATVKSNGHDSVLIVTDKGLMGLHLLDGLFEELEKCGVRYTVYDGVQQNPTIPNIEEAKALYEQNECKAVIAFGGGSPMDCAKVAAARVRCPNKSVRKMRGTFKIMKKLPTLYAVPTTAGTGSETTITAIVSDPETHEKYGVHDPVLRPAYAVLDAELTVGLPPHITATTGMDALTHAVEAYIGQSNTKRTASEARKATRMIFDNLETAYRDGKNIRSRENMLEASYHAGIAFRQAYVGYIHAIAHNIGGMYGTPHGLANAVIMPYVLDWYGESAHKRLAELADVACIVTTEKTDAEKAALMIRRIREFNRDMGIPEHLDAIKEEDVQTIAERALFEGNPLYPVPKIMNKQQCAALIRKIGGLAE
ncbi:MAG: iron-containing alcohol dehydrogenase [Clostridia bacterium]|nr:iron-containing alcohol dehydrogenase [Clostridia bacterium]